MLSIDVTDLNSFELISVLRHYPKGKLTIKYERVFWDSEVNMQTSPMPPEARSGMPRDPTITQRFQKMSDTLGQMVC